MAKPISFADLDSANTGLKKARALLSMLQDTEQDEDTSWFIAAVFDYVHDTMKTIDELIEEARK